MYFAKSVGRPAKVIHHAASTGWPYPKRIIFIAFMAAFASLFQSAGGFLPGIGYLISPLATAPIVLGFAVSVRYGWTAYALTIFLLLLVQPSELIVFPFTTGILGAGLGMAFALVDKRINVIMSGGILLFAGIVFLLYGVGFPVLGPGMAITFKWSVVVVLFAFSIVYSWLWTEICIVLFNRIVKILSPSK
jgi:hypothetical protein